MSCKGPHYTDLTAQRLAVKVEIGGLHRGVTHPDVPAEHKRSRSNDLYQR